MGKITRKTQQSSSSALSEGFVPEDKAKLVALISSLSEKFEDLNEKVAPLLEYFDKSMKYVKGDEVLDYLKVKKQILLSYVTNLVFYVQLKLEGKSCADHPVMAALLELRYAMEKMRAMDGKLKYQVDRLLKAVETGAAGDKSGGMRPNPMALLAKDDGCSIAEKIDDEDDDDDEEDGDASDDDDRKNNNNNNSSSNNNDGIYRPPRMEAAYFMDAESKAEKQEEALKRKRKKLKNSEIFDALRSEFSSAPEVSGSTGISSLSALEKKLKEDARERQDFEEDRFVRMTVTRKEKQAMKKSERDMQSTNVLGGFGNVDDLDELVDQFNEVAEASGSNKKGKKGGSIGVGGRGNFEFGDGGDGDARSSSAGADAKGKRRRSAADAASSMDAISKAAMAFTNTSTSGSGGGSGKKKKKTSK
jgi:U3 small nucleolar ribonucleoprotein protein LCP5